VSVVAADTDVAELAVGKGEVAVVAVVAQAREPVVAWMWEVEHGVAARNQRGGRLPCGAHTVVDSLVVVVVVVVSTLVVVVVVVVSTLAVVVVAVSTLVVVLVAADSQIQETLVEDSLASALAYRTYFDRLPLPWDLT
jgi:Flp pilus assembly protein TadB